MRLFQLYGSQDYWSIYFKDKDYIEIEDKWNLTKKGISVAKDWKKVEVEIVFKGKQRKNKPDIIDFGGCAGIAISSQAKDTLKSLLMPYCELLPVNLRGIEIYIINPITVLDCLDYDNSIIELAPPLYNYQRIIKYVLKKEIKYPPIFRIINSPRRIFINDVFVKALEESHLIGYSIEELWNSEE